MKNELTLNKIKGGILSVYFYVVLYLIAYVDSMSQWKIRFEKAKHLIFPMWSKL